MKYIFKDATIDWLNQRASDESLSVEVRDDLSKKEFGKQTMIWLKRETLNKGLLEEVKEDIIDFIFASEGKKRGELFAAALKQAREAAGLSVAEAAEKANTSEEDWLKYENADIRPKDIELIERLARAVSIEPLELISNALDNSVLFKKKEE